jgi:hypothetical protein
MGVKHTFESLTMPEPDLPYAVRQFEYQQMRTDLAQLQREGRVAELHCTDPRAGTHWHTFAYSLDVKNHRGLLEPDSQLTQNAIAVFAELAARWLDPTYALKGIGGITHTALETMQSSSRKVPNWAKDAFSFYIEYYNAKLSGTENPDIAIKTDDPIAQQAIDAFLERKDEFSFSEARQQQAQQNTQPAQTAAATLSPLTTIYPPPSLNGPAANCHRRRQDRESHTESTTGTRRFLSSST